MDNDSLQNDARSSKLGDEYSFCWNQEESTPDVFSFLCKHTPSSETELLDVLMCDQFRRSQRDLMLPVEDYIRKCPAVASSKDLQRDLIEHDVFLRRKRGESLDLDAILARFPMLADLLRDRLQERDQEEHSSRLFCSTKTFDGPVDETSQDQDEASRRNVAQDRKPPSVPQSIGRYRVKRILGEGGFGRVYLAQDDQLDRLVAIKLPHEHRLVDSGDIEAMMDEGRIIASLDHPNIVPVYDVGRTSDGVCFIVSKFIEGTNLRDLSREKRLSRHVIVRLMAEVADGLQYAHRRGLVHRDIKPENLLLDKQHRIFIADFGIALRETQQSQYEGEVSGTPTYMSPEQVRGKAHQLDGRADIWSVGVTLYRLLTGRKPFTGDSVGEIIDKIKHREPKPPRQIDESIPLELERICLKCMAKEVTLRYTSAADLARDLRKCDRKPPIFQRPTVLASIAAAIIVATLLVAVGIRLIQRDPSPDPNDTTVTEKREQQRKELAETISQIKALLDESHQNGFRHQSGSSDEARGSSVLAPIPLAKIHWPQDLQGLSTQIQRARASGDDDDEFNLLMRASNELIDRGHFGSAESLAYRMIEVAGSNPSRQPFARSQLGIAQYRNGKARTAVKNFQKSIEIYQSLYDGMQARPDSPQIRKFSSHLARLLGIDHMRLGNSFKEMMDYDQAREEYSRALELFEKHDRKQELATLLTNFGNLESQCGNYDLAKSLHGRGLELACSLNDSVSETDILVNLGNAHSRQGELELAVEAYEKAHRLMRPSASYEAQSVLLSQWVTALIELERLDEARVHLGEFQAIVQPRDKRSRELLEYFSRILGEPSQDSGGIQRPGHPHQ